MENIEQIQYIGARYTTKIYENSQDPSSAEWEANVNYEPLTLVTEDNSTYLSRKVVPRNIGKPSENGAYWALTGAYNGQIASLQNQIDAINNSIITINNDISELRTGYKRVVVIADSYDTPNTGYVGFTSTLQDILGLNSSDFFAFHIGGLGFVNDVSGYTADTFLTAMLGNIISKETITDVIFAFGINDANNTTTKSALISKMEDAAEVVNTNMPKANIHIAYTGYNIGDGFDASYYINSLKWYMEGATAIHAKFMHGVEFVMHNRRYFRSGDHIHPNQDGGNHLALTIAECLIQGSASVIMNVSAIDFSTSDITVYFGGNLENDTISLYANLKFDTAVSLTAGTWQTILTLTDVPPFAGTSGSPLMFIGVMPDTSSNYHMCMFSLYDHTLQICPSASGTYQGLGRFIRGNAPTLFC